MHVLNLEIRLNPSGMAHLNNAPMANDAQLFENIAGLVRRARLKQRSLPLTETV